MIPRRFIVLGHGRSGSSLLVESLNRHPAIHCHGEIFHNDLPHREAAFGAVYQPGASAAGFCREHAHHPPPEFAKRVIGFKLFFFHARGDAMAHGLWDHLAADTDIGVITIRRRNLFDAFVSQMRAQASARWRQNPGEAPIEEYLRPIRMSPVDCEQYMRVILAGMEMMGRLFARHRVLAVEYEDLADDYGRTMARCFEFLGEPAVAVTPPLRKMNTIDHRAGITNFEEVARYFALTPFGAFLPRGR